MPSNFEENKIAETTLERTKRLIADVEEMISTTGEHPEYELKMKWAWDTPYLKAKVIKDTQSIANSKIPLGNTKFIIIGADEKTREITGCDHKDYDEAKIRQLFETYLEPVPEYEILYPKAKNGNGYVVLMFPHQSRKPFFVKREIVDEKKERYLSIGEVWLKPDGSTGKKRLASRTDLLDMIDIDALVNKEVEYKISQILPEIRNEERSRIGNAGFGAIPSLTSTEVEFELFTEQLIASSDLARFKILVQKLRDKCVESWEIKIDEEKTISLEDLSVEKNLVFLPAMRRLALLGILLIKYDAPLIWFDSIAEFLIDTFNVSNKLSKIVPTQIDGERAKSLETHLDVYVPALESLMVSYLLIGYETKRKSNIKFSSTFFPRIVTYRSNSIYSSGEHQSFFLFYPFYSQTIDRRIDLLVTERFKEAGRILEYFGGETSLKKAILQVIALVDWLSFLSFENLSKESATSKYFEEAYPNVNAAYIPAYVQESLENITPLVKMIWSDLSLGEKNYFLFDKGLAKVFSTLSVENREQIFARFLIEAYKNHAERMHANMRFPFEVHWSEEINSVIKLVRSLGK